MSRICVLNLSRAFDAMRRSLPSFEMLNPRNLRSSGRAGKREIDVAYGAGMARSMLKIPVAATGTARNIDTIAKLVELAGAT
jgi:hypothetical protein